MRIVGIVPDRVLPDQVRREREAWLAERTDADVVVVNPTEGPDYVEAATDQVHAAPHVLELGRNAHADGADAVVLLCMTDPAIEALREHVSCPVVGAATAAIAFTAAVVETAVIVTITPQAIAPIHQRVRTAPGGADIIRDIVSIDMSIAAMRRDYDGVVDKAATVVGPACERTGAQGVLLGCTEMGMHTAERLSERLNLPVVDPNLAAFSLATSLVRGQSPVPTGNTQT